MVLARLWVLVLKSQRVKTDGRVELFCCIGIWELFYGSVSLCV